MSPLPQALSAGSPALESGSDEPWKQLTRRANQAREAGDPALARALYEAALTDAERVFEVARQGALPDAVPLAPMLCTISCHNLAELLLEQGDTAGALHCFEHAFQRLVEGASAAEHALELRVGCARHLQIATAALAQHLVQHAERARAEACVQRANAAIFAVLELTRAAERTPS